MQFDTVIIGAGAAGMMCAAHAGGRVLLIDHAKAPGEKIRISGGGRCNFTNMHCTADTFLSGNPHFVKSALARYSQWDFLDLVNRHQISWHEKTLGQLFCDHSAKDIIAMLRGLMQDAGVDLRLLTTAQTIEKTADGFALSLRDDTGQTAVRTRNLVLATGGKSIPKMGATGFAYDIARQFGIPVTPTRPGLVPFTFPERRFADISGLSCPSRITPDGPAFDEALLFTHRGLSGPAVLQVSSYWREGQSLTINLFPGGDLLTRLHADKHTQGKRSLHNVLAQYLPARLVDHLGPMLQLSGNLADQNSAELERIASALHNWEVTPGGTEGYRTAEVTLGGVDTQALSSKTMEVKAVPGLYFIGEAVDVTGWLGGFNFQWAWSSAMAAAQAIRL